MKQGAVVVALDLDPKVETLFNSNQVIGVTGDVTKETNLKTAIKASIVGFGGLDIIVSNAGVFPPSSKIESLEGRRWQQSLDVNLTSHQQLLRLAIPFLKLGISQ